MANLSLRDLGRHVGMRAQSLYSYFPSKHAIYDALFAQGYEELESRMRAECFSRDPLDAQRHAARVFVRFAT